MLPTRVAQAQRRVQKQIVVLPRQASQKRCEPCRAFYLQPAVALDHELEAIRKLAGEELVLESSLHASSLTVVQCMVSYGVPQQAPTLVDHRALVGNSALRGTPIAALLGTVQEDREADLAACLATPSTAESEESLEKHRVPIRQRAVVEEQDSTLEAMMQQSSGSQPGSKFTRSRRSLDANSLLKLTSMLPACPFTGKRLETLLQA